LPTPFGGKVFVCILRLGVANVILQIDGQFQTAFGQAAVIGDEGFGSGRGEIG
jgi:hypothetical protein